jgi:GNAT superfamily N-acetyltransferase
MSVGKKIGLSYKQLGIGRHSEHGRLILAQWLPETGEVFLLRERKEPVDEMTYHLIPLNRLHELRENRRLTLLRLGEKGEESIGHALYAPLRDSIYIGNLETHGTERKRNVASSLLAYIKTHGKDMWLTPNTRSVPFYTRLGFSSSRKYNGYELPAEKPLRGKGIKFLIRQGKK